MTAHPTPPPTTPPPPPIPLRRRLFVPCVLGWTALAWVAVIGIRAPIDPSTAAWSHAAGQLIIILTAGVVLAWPASMLIAHRDLCPCFGESVLLSLLLGGAVMGLRLTADNTAASAGGAALVLGLWTLSLGAMMAVAQIHGRWIGWVACGAALVLLPLSAMLEPSLRTAAGPLAAAWALSIEPHSTPADLLAGLVSSATLAIVCWCVCLAQQRPNEENAQPHG